MRCKREILQGRREWRTTRSASRRLLLLVPLSPCLLVFFINSGCETPRKIRQDPSFGPTKVRVHPTFTQVKDWSGDGKADGVEAVVELLDEFDEPTRGAGTLLFELHNYRRDHPQPAGIRVAEPWTGALLTKEDQPKHWSPALRAYTFQLPYPQVDTGQTYVLVVTFETVGGATREGGGRLFDRVILEPPPDKRSPGPPVRRAGGRR
jgi:hypothetical protein